MNGALNGLRVLDLTRVLAGPWATQILADLGAEVIKIERPGTGDDTRGWGPPFLRRPDGSETSEAAYFLAANRGKKSVTVNLSTTSGAQIIRELANHSDIIIENFKVGDMRRYGLDYESLKAQNPRLIYCSITGFGQTGPYSDRAGYDFIIQGMGGLMSITGPGADESPAGPQKVGVPIADLMTGMYATTAILAALAYRNITNEGQYIDMSLLDVQVGFLANQNMNYLATGNSPKRMGNAHPNIVPYQTFASSDGAINLGVGNDGQFAKFCVIAGLDDLAKDPKFSTHSSRVINRKLLIPQIAQQIARHPSAYWVEKLAAIGVPCGPVNDLEAVFQDPQVQSRHMKIALHHPEVGNIDLVANPIKFSKTSIQYGAPPPRLGEHTDEVLANILGLTSAEISQLRAESTI